MALLTILSDDNGSITVASTPGMLDSVTPDALKNEALIVSVKLRMSIGVALRLRTKPLNCGGTLSGVYVDTGMAPADVSSTIGTLLVSCTAASKFLKYVVSLSTASSSISLILLASLLLRRTVTMVSFIVDMLPIMNW